MSSGLAMLGRSKVGAKLIERERLKQIELATERGEDPSRFDREPPGVEPGTPEFRYSICWFMFAFFLLIGIYCCAVFYGKELIFGYDASTEHGMVLAGILAIPFIFLCCLSWKGIKRLCEKEDEPNATHLDDAVAVTANSV